MTRFRIRLAYLGTPYCGWQIQRTSESCRPSVQGVVRDMILKITQESVNIVASGRTDAGVHASGQIAHFSLKKKTWNPKSLFQALNSLLPGSIRVLDLLPVSAEFDASKASRKQYSYYLQLGPSELPQWRSRALWIRQELDFEKMKLAASHFIGTHDFKAYKASGSSAKTSIRTIYDFKITKMEQSFFNQHMDTNRFYCVCLSVTGSGFLKQMVRGMVGTLLNVAKGKLLPDDVKNIIAAEDRSMIGTTAPAHGLWLERVWYEFDNLDEAGLVR